MALQYAARNYAVVVSGRRIDLLEALVNAIQAKAGEAYAVYCDVTDEASIQDAVSAIVAQYGKLT
jgi:NADP-dependent 3-hydroxy acid dehydrogenase YdfG